MDKVIRAPHPSALINEVFTPAFLARSLVRTWARKRPPRGQGEQVLVWPGFGANNASTAMLRQYLRRLGYRVEGSPVSRISTDVLDTKEHLQQDLVSRFASEPVTLIGWSLGGVLAREVARDCPEHVRQVITLGSPVIGGPKYTAVAGAFAHDEDALDEIERQAEARFAKPLTVPVTALYSKSDGVVAWQACIDERSPSVEHIEVATTHLGFAFDAQVLQIIAERLAGPVAAA